MAIVVAVCYYLLPVSDWVTFRLVPIVITVGFLFSVANDIRKMRAAS
jgi:hypothetical protein